MWTILKEHVRQFWLIYLTLAGVYIAGVVFGAVGTGALGSSESTQLGKFLDSLLSSQPDKPDPQFLKFLARDTFVIMAAIWILGLTVIGTPLVYFIVFTRGFVLGFTVSFFIHMKGLFGLGLALLTILFPALIAVPLLFLGAGTATIFSFMLLRGRTNGEYLRREFLYYTASATLVLLGSVLAGVAQGYFSLLGVHLFNL
ncbi:MAG: stage II sporulation protein M [Desulfitobacteriaceae bacterium]|nr:stage II sporulation protein M [Desulfitobacteriaceae bacterium]MDD4347092.1 stage II sporulation protein M [Desulfitobacteriaceae bacterium]MDD4402440.1 stage II sporulation protein M [Desulfitobacteriaceae bacterium]